MRAESEPSRVEPSSAGHVLVVDDDPTVRDVVSRYLARARYRVSLAGDGERGLHLAVGTGPDRPDLVVLDLMLPGRSGLEICAELRQRSSVPVIMLTALGEEEDRLAGLRLGADDYVTKPFSPRELVLRVGSVLRRSRDVVTAPRTEPPVVDGDLLVDVAARRAVLAGRELALTVREFDLLAFLAAHPGQAFTRDDLMEHVWRTPDAADTSTVTVHVRRLRAKLEPDPERPRWVQTVWGIGYRFAA